MRHDSTVRNHTKGQLGWGDPISDLFDPAKINVEDRALRGRSSRTFFTEGLWDKVLADINPGDFVLMQFDLNEIVATHYESAGQPKVAAEYFGPTDHTHTTAAGAKLNAGCVVEGIRELEGCPLREDLLGGE